MSSTQEQLNERWTRSISKRQSNKHSIMRNESNIPKIDDSLEFAASNDKFRSRLAPSKQQTRTSGGDFNFDSNVAMMPLPLGLGPSLSRDSGGTGATEPVSKHFSHGETAEAKLEHPADAANYAHTDEFRNAANFLPSRESGAQIDERIAFDCRYWDSRADYARYHPIYGEYHAGIETATGSNGHPATILPGSHVLHPYPPNYAYPRASAYYYQHPPMYYPRPPTAAEQNGLLAPYTQNPVPAHFDNPALNIPTYPYSHAPRPKLEEHVESTGSIHQDQLDRLDPNLPLNPSGYYQQYPELSRVNDILIGTTLTEHRIPMPVELEPRSRDEENEILEQTKKRHHKHKRRRKHRSKGRSKKVKNILMHDAHVDVGVDVDAIRDRNATENASASVSTNESEWSQVETAVLGCIVDTLMPNKKRQKKLSSRDNIWQVAAFRLTDRSPKSCYLKWKKLKKFNSSVASKSPKPKEKDVPKLKSSQSENSKSETDVEVDSKSNEDGPKSKETAVVLDHHVRISERVFSKKNVKGDERSRTNNAIVIVRHRWTFEETQKLRELTLKFGSVDRWAEIAKELNASFSRSGILRTSTQCRQKWEACFDPKRLVSSWSEEEIKILFEEQEKLGNKWALISKKLPGRTRLDVKNFWSSRRRIYHCKTKTAEQEKLP